MQILLLARRCLSGPAQGTADHRPTQPRRRARTRADLGNRRSVEPVEPLADRRAGCSAKDP